MAALLMMVSNSIRSKVAVHDGCRVGIEQVQEELAIVGMVLVLPGVGLWDRGVQFITKTSREITLSRMPVQGSR